MNMFRDLMILFMLGSAAALTFADPLDWKALTVAGPYVVQGVTFMVQAKPFSVVILLALALALFMTRLKY